MGRLELTDVVVTQHTTLQYRYDGDSSDFVLIDRDDPGVSDSVRFNMHFPDDFTNWNGSYDELEKIYKLIGYALYEEPIDEPDIEDM